MGLEESLVSKAPPWTELSRATPTRAYLDGVGDSGPGAILYSGDYVSCAGDGIGVSGERDSQLIWERVSEGTNQERSKGRAGT